MAESAAFCGKAQLSPVELRVGELSGTLEMSRVDMVERLWLVRNLTW